MLRGLIAGTALEGAVLKMRVILDGEERLNILLDIAGPNGQESRNLDLLISLRSDRLRPAVVMTSAYASIREQYSVEIYGRILAWLYQNGFTHVRNQKRSERGTAFSKKFWTF